jgi:hypothetical protein
MIVFPSYFRTFLGLTLDVQTLYEMGYVLRCGNLQARRWSRSGELEAAAPSFVLCVRSLFPPVSQSARSMASPSTGESVLVFSSES